MVTIRRATPDDLEEVGELTVAAYAPFLRGPTDGYADHLRDAAGRHARAELWVATESDGGLLGTVTTTPEGSAWREIGRPGEAEFRMLAVAPAAQGRGVGEALVRHAIETARAAGAHAVAMSSLREMAAAHRIYERLGFVREPDRDWSPAPDVHLIAFRKALED